MESSETIQSERLGAVLVEKHLITEEQLERALVLQEESGKRLGEILVAEFGVSRLEVAGALSEQWAGAEKPEPEGPRPVEPLTPAEVRLRRPLGELLVMRGFITADQLDAALEEQRRSGARIGEILVERGAISRLDLAAAISDYGSSAGGLRSPGHAAGPQPSHDGSPGASSAQGWSADGLALVADLEARLQTLERAAGGAPWQEDLRLVAFDIRAAISVVEARLDAVGPSPGEADLVAALGAVSSRIDALENVPVAAELEALREELEGLKAGPVTMEEIADLRATVERLEALPDQADEIPRLASEIAVLAARSDEFAVRVEGLALPVAGLAPRIDGLAARVEEVAAAIPVVETDGLAARIELLEEGSRAGGGSLEQLAAEVAVLASRLAEVPDAGELSGRLEAVAERAEVAQAGVAGLSGRVEELAASVPSGEVIAELRRQLSDLAVRAEADDGAELGAAVASLAGRLDEFAVRVEGLALPVAGLAPRIDGLAARVEEVAAAIPVVETDGLAARIELLEEGSRAGGGSLEQLAAEVAVLASRLAEVPDAGELSGRLEAVAERAEVAQAGVAGLSGRVEELAASVPSGEVIAELRRQLSDLAARAEADDGAELGAAVASLAGRLDEFGVRVEGLALPVAGLAPRIDGLAARVEEVAAAIPVVETDGLAARIELLEEGSRAGGGSLEQLAAEVAVLASRLAEVPDAGELSGRLEAVAERAEVAQAGVAGLSGRVEELAASVPSGEVIAELRRQLSDLAARAEADDGAELGAAVASLAGRLDEFAVRVEGLALPVAGLAPRIDGLAARVEEVAAAIPVVETDGLVARIELLEEGSRAGGGSLEHLAAETSELRSQLQELTIASAQDESVALLEARVGELEHRVAVTAELRDEIQRVGAGASAGRDSLARELFARVEEITASVPAADEVTELRLRVDELASRPMEDHVLQARVGELAARIEALALVETDALVARIELLEEGSRAGGGSLEQLAAETSELRSQLQELTIASAQDESVALLEARVGELEHRIAVTAELRDEIQRVGAGASAGRDSLARELFARVEEITASVPAADEVTELRLRVDELASRPMEDHVLQARVGELAARIEALALVEATVAGLTASVAGLDGRIDSCVRDGHERVDGLAEELSTRIGGLAKELSRRIDSVVARADGFVSRDQVEATAAEQAAWIRDELEVLREWTNVHAAAVDVALAGADDARVTGQQELGNRLDEAAGALRAEAEAQARELEARLGASASETAVLRTRVDALQESAADRIGWEARLESMLEQRLDELTARITDEVAGARADAEHAVDAIRGTTDWLGGRIDELHGLHHADLQDVRSATERLVDRVEAESALRAGDAESARAAAAELSARVDDHAIRNAATACEIEQRLQEEIGCLAAQLEERDASGIEARDELRVELERVASSMGWRLERIEESLAADDGAELNATVAELGRRLDEQAAIAEEQARATERALRKGLASLGERLVDTESAYADAGKALRRSIERLGAAVVEADARMADQIPVSEAEGCVAFAPTADGYRLVELPGRPPEIGSTLELDVCDGPLVVTRYGSSPLPLDSRSCAYLERA